MASERDDLRARTATLEIELQTHQRTSDKKETELLSQIFDLQIRVATLENYRLQAIAARDRRKKLKRKVKRLARELDIMVGAELSRRVDNAKTKLQEGSGSLAPQGQMDRSGLRRVGMNLVGIFRGRSAEKTQS